jgi:hypothetical protein
VLGFHGTDQSIAREVVLQQIELIPSSNAWDWIGHGVYFWEHSPSRAFEFALETSRRKGSNIITPAVLGAVIDLGNCLDLLDYQNLQLLKSTYYRESEKEGLRNLKNSVVMNSNSTDLLLRRLDCAVVEALHRSNTALNLPPYDSVKAVFWEGQPLYPNAGFREKNHIQICIRNPGCIKGYFIPRT